MKKHLRTLSVCLALSVCLGVLPARAAAGHFNDVPSTHWASGFINEMAEGGLIAGYGGETAENSV